MRLKAMSCQTVENPTKTYLSPDFHQCGIQFLAFLLDTTLPKIYAFARFSSTWYDKLRVLSIASIWLFMGTLSFAQENSNVVENNESLVKERWLVGANIEIRPYYQAIESQLDPWRSFGTARLNTELNFLPDIEILVAPFMRIPFKSKNPWESCDKLPAQRAFVSLDDSFLKVKAEHLQVRFGYLVIPWSVSKASQLNNRLNPIDYRLGPDYPLFEQGKMPQWGSVATFIMEPFTIEALVLFHHDASLGSLIASEQGGVRIGRYQGAFFPTQLNMHGEGWLKSRSELHEELPFFDTPSAGLGLKFNIAHMDIGVNGAWHFDEVPSLTADNHLHYSHTATFALSVIYDLEEVIFKAEALIQPIMGSFGGKPTLFLAPDHSIYSQSSSFYALSLAVDAVYSHWISASLEIFDMLWWCVSSQGHMLGLEPLRARVTERDFFNRLALGIVASGVIPWTVLSWNIRGEIGLSQLDFLGQAELRYNLLPSPAYLGLNGTLFDGIPGGPGWFRKKASKAGIFFGVDV